MSSESVECFRTIPEKIAESDVKRIIHAWKICRDHGLVLQLLFDDPYSPSLEKIERIIFPYQHDSIEINLDPGYYSKAA